MLDIPGIETSILAGIQNNPVKLYKRKYHHQNTNCPPFPQGYPSNQLGNYRIHGYTHGWVLGRLKRLQSEELKPVMARPPSVA